MSTYTERKQSKAGRERQREKANNQKPTEVVGNIELPFDVRAKDSGNTDNNNLNPFAHSGKKSNVFGISINYPPDENEKEAIKRINNEDIFPANIAAPTLEDDEKCEHGNKSEESSQLYCRTN